MASLLLSQGVPMILAGDEVLRTQRGNNNAYCQDNADQLVRLAAGRAQRRDAPLRAGAQRVPPPAAERPPRRVPHRQGHEARPTAGRQLVQSRWHARQLEHRHGPSLTSVFGTSGLTDPAARAVMIMLHCGNQPVRIRDAAAPAASYNWRLFIDTAAAAPDDIYPEADGPALGREPVMLDSHTLRCYVAE